MRFWIWALVAMIVFGAPALKAQATCEVPSPGGSDNVQTKDEFDGTVPPPTPRPAKVKKLKTAAQTADSRKLADHDRKCRSMMTPRAQDVLSGPRLAQPAYPLFAPRPIRRTRVQWDVEDFNGDGRIDSVIPTAGTQLRMQFGQANGTLGTAQIRQVPGALISAVRARDENGDGKQDLIFCCGTIAGQFQAGILLGNGDGTFQDPRPAAPANQNLQFLFWSGDWNRDGRGDVMVGAPGSGTVVNLALGRGDGTFEAVRALPIPACTRTMIEGDFNGDTRPDLVLGCQRQAVILPQQTDGSLGAATTLTLEVPNVNYLMAADWNRDGRDDLVMMDTFEGVMQAYLSQPDRTYRLTDPAAVPADFEGAWLLSESASVVPALLVPNPASTFTKLVLLSDDGGLFAPPLLPPAPRGVPGFAVADFTGDGKADVAVSSGAADTRVRLSRFPATLYRPERVGESVITGALASRIEAADMNGDQRPDLVAAAGDSVAVWRNTNGAFAAFTQSPIGGGTLGRFVLADLNGDGRLDLAGVVTTSSSAGRISVMLGNGQGGFGTPLNLTFLQLPGAVAAADLDGDGRTDLVVGSSENFGVTQYAVFWNEGNGTFSAPQRLPTPTEGFGGTGAIATGDVNGDGRQDVLVSGNFNSSVLSVHLGQAGRQFRAPLLQRGFDSPPNNLLLRDLNRDGRVDLLATACCGQLPTTVHWGRGDGTFGAGFPVFGVTNANEARFADVDGDGQDEVILLKAAGVAIGDLRLIPPSTAQVSAASSTPVIARNSIVSAYGTGLATATAGATALNQVDIAGTRVWIRAFNQDYECPLFFVSPGQVNYLIPSTVSAGLVTVTIASGDGSVSAGEMEVRNVGPGLFLAGATPFVAANVIRVLANGTQQREEVLNAALAPIPVNVANAAEKVVLVLFGTGIRGRSALSAVSVRVGGQPVTVEFAGAQGAFAGLDQVNVVLPPSLAGRGDVAVELTVDGVAANVGRIVIR